MTGRQKKALSALLDAPTIKSAAAIAGVGYSTLREWLRSDEDFKAAYRGAVDEIVNDAVFEARKSISPAIAALKSILQDKSQNGAVVAQAARTLLEYGLKLTERADIAERISALEDNENGL